MRKEMNPGAATHSASDFINVFHHGINRDSNRTEEGEGADEDVEEERDLRDDERDILAQFEENDKELEDIAAQIVGALDELKGKAENIEGSIKR